MNFQSTALKISCVFLLFSLANYPQPTPAQNLSFLKKADSKKIFQNFQRPRLPNNGAPTGRQRGGTGREPNCSKQLSQMTALVPTFKEEKTGLSKSSMETTVAKYPTFWVYVPKLSGNAREAEFILQDIDNQKNIYSKKFSLSGNSGIISIHLPNKPLQIDTRYRWFLKVYCSDSPNGSGEYVYIDSYIKRITINSAIETNDYLAYAKHNLWYETITKLAEKRRHDSSTAITQDWLELLKYVKLENNSNTNVIKNYIFN
jgi:Domain of Unknown Function (DUF928)